MKNQNKTLPNAGQSKGGAAQNQKREVNLRKNSLLYFQIGLILCLLAVYGLLEMNFEKKTFEVAVLKMEEEDTFEMKNYIPEKTPDFNKEPIKKKRVITVKPPVIVSDDTADEVVATVIDTELPSIDAPVSIDSIDIIDMVEPIDPPLCISCVEIAPIYPGCEKEKTNEGRTRCMSQKLSKLVQREFRSDVANSNLRGIQKIDVQFKIDKTGVISEIKTRAPSLSLEKEAKRVMEKVPEMIPGKQQKKPVSVFYNLPIVFKLQD